MTSTATSTSPQRVVKVLVVDDSALVRKMLGERLGRMPRIQVVGTANGPVAAWEQIRTLRPDVLTLDVEMPEMDGVSFLKLLMRDYPLPTVMVSSLTVRGAEITLDALEAGATDFVTKPGLGASGQLDALVPVIAEKLLAAASARPRARVSSKAPVARPATRAMADTTDKVIAMGASTGGTEAVREVLEQLPGDAPGVVIVQHMPEYFTASWAKRCDATCAVRVSEATDGERILSGHALIAPGNRHMEVVRRGAYYHVRLSDGPPVNRHRPSVDVLFESVARNVGRNAAGVILTGMGADGATGLLSMRRAGAATFAQDAESCVVYGMPREAVALGAAEAQVPLTDVAPRLLGTLGRR